mgnify:CR=1 FL=1
MSDNIIKNDNRKRTNRVFVRFEVNIPKYITRFRYIELFIFVILFLGLILNFKFGNIIPAVTLMLLGFVYVVFEILNGMYWRIKRDFDDYHDEINITRPLVYEWCAVFAYILMYGNASKYMPQISNVVKAIIFAVIALFAILLNVIAHKIYKFECEESKRESKIFRISDEQFDTLYNSAKEKFPGDKTDKAFDKFRSIRQIANDTDADSDTDIELSEEEADFLKKIAAEI